MEFSIVESAAMNVIGVELRTTNTDNEAMTKIPEFKQYHEQQGTLEKIPNKVSEKTSLVAYTDYDSSGYYTCFFGVEVTSLDSIPDGMVGRHVPAGKYACFTVRGKREKIIPAAWQHIWAAQFDFERAFGFDFEWHDQDLADEHGVEIDIYVSIV